MLPTSGYSGFKSKYRMNINKSVNKDNPLNNFNVGPMTAKLKNNIYEEISEHPEYKTLPQGFQTTMKKTGEEKPRENVKLPSVGYTGHRPGNDSLGFFGKSYRECSIHSKWIQTNAK